MKNDILFIDILSLLMINSESTKKFRIAAVKATTLTAHTHILKISKICAICVGAIADYSDYIVFCSY